MVDFGNLGGFACPHFSMHCSTCVSNFCPSFLVLGIDGTALSDTLLYFLTYVQGFFFFFFGFFIKIFCAFYFTGLLDWCKWLILNHLFIRACPFRKGS